jgi:hypothetical protein
MDIISAYREVGSHRGAAEICATTAKTVKRVVEAAHRTDTDSPTPHNYDSVAELAAQRIEKTKGRITAKRLLPAADDDSGNSPLSIIEIPHLRVAVGCC